MLNDMHPMLIIQFVALPTLANGTPVIAKKLLGTLFDQPLDCGVVLPDGQPLFGTSKTIRGIVLSIATTTALTPLLGFDWTVGLIAAAMAMLGDLFSSFVKRRLRLQPSSRATGLDQIPECLLPAVACRSLVGLSAVDVVAVTVIFTVGEMLLSRLLFRWHLRDRPF
jgi:CDP-2,3-bis-(O-geranylgeranyl)-sn-glycerol synthase